MSLAFKAYEIEELADVYFFRPLGMAVALAARALGVTPAVLTAAGAAIGIVGGSLLRWDSLALAGFFLLIVHGIVDSADGQLARLTGKVSELGRILDGLSGYVTHIAVYVAIVAGAMSRGTSASIVFWAVLAALSNVVHAQMYDYHRASYADLVIRGVVPRHDSSGVDAEWVRPLLRAYLAVQRRLIGLHGEVEAAIGARAANGMVREEDRASYRATFYWPVRGWNVLGDNTRFYAIGVLAWLHRLDWFFFLVLVPMNMAFVALWMWQQRADRRFRRVW